MKLTFDSSKSMSKDSNLKKLKKKKGNLLNFVYDLTYKFIKKILYK